MKKPVLKIITAQPEQIIASMDFPTTASASGGL
jgi:hypothetical protein